MNSDTRRNHMIDLIFPIALFFIFALCALTVLLFAARIYQSQTEASSRNYTAGTALSYISEKIHQNDSEQAVKIGEFHGREALILSYVSGEEAYDTYIYEDEEQLKELFVRHDTDADLSFGTPILEIREFSMEQREDGLLAFHCTDKHDQSASILVAIRSKERN